MLLNPLIHHNIKFSHSYNTSLSYSNFRLPEDTYIFDFFSLISSQYLIGGSVSEHLYLKHNDSASFKDLDITVGTDFVDGAKKMYPVLQKMLTDFNSFSTSYCDEYGILSPIRYSYKNGNQTYPVKLAIFVNNITVDLNTGNINMIPYITINAWGRHLKIVAPAHRVNILKSFSHTEWAKTKNPSVQKRIEMLNTSIDSTK